MAAATAAAAVATGRRAAESLMVDTCVIRRTTSESTDRLTGHTLAITSVVYNGRCRIQQRVVPNQETELADAEVVVVARDLQLPVATSVGVRAGDEVEMTACVHDEDLVGRRFRIRGEHTKTHATARRLAVEEVTG
jgi:hypothetical protein